jgi:hypothetical protein
VTYKLTVNQPNLGDEGEVYISGLGTFKNGTTTEVSDEEELNFRTVNAHDIGGIDGDPESETFGSAKPNLVPGQSLVDAAKSMYGVTVEQVQSTPSKTAGGQTGSTTTGGETGSTTNTNGGSQ